MTNIYVDRRTVLKIGGISSALLVAPAVLTRRAQAAEFEYKLATTIIPDHPINQHARDAAAAILAESKGRVSIQVFPGYQLGSSTSIITQVRSGAVEFATLSGAVLSALVPSSTIYNVAFAFKDINQVFAALDGKMGDSIRADINKVGLHAMEKHWNLGFRQITTRSRAVTGPADLKDVKIRVAVAPLILSCFKALGAAPAPINFDELYTALQTGVVDGQENDLFQIRAGRIFEVQKYCALSNHIWDGYFTLVNGNVWKGLPEDLQQIVSRNLNAAAVRQRDDLQQKLVPAAEALKAAGIQFNEVDIQAFRTALSKAGFYTDWKEKFGKATWSLLEETSGPLT
jgi:tripartite ATP-independent transporter DctP family solute receptor